jgi:hypothetical protein
LSACDGNEPPFALSDCESTSADDLVKGDEERYDGPRATWLLAAADRDFAFVALHDVGGADRALGTNVSWPHWRPDLHSSIRAGEVTSNAEIGLDWAGFGDTIATVGLHGYFGHI